MGKYHTDVATKTRKAFRKNSSSTALLSSVFKPAWCTAIPADARAVMLSDFVNCIHQLLGRTSQVLIMKVLLDTEQR